MNRLQAFLRRAGKSDYYTEDFTITALCEQADKQNSYLGHSNIIPFTRFIVFYHLTAAHHTSPVPRYIIMSYPPNTAVLMTAILFTVYCKGTVFSVLIFFYFFIV